jgi:hypothetical protein
MAMRPTSVLVVIIAIALGLSMFVGMVMLVFGSSPKSRGAQASVVTPEQMERDAAMAKEQARAAEVRAKVEADAKRRQSACYAARIAVERQLKAPSTAKFPSCLSGDVGVTLDAEDGLVHVSGHVDSQNSFGAMLRARFYVKMAEGDGEYAVRSVRVR